MTKQSKLTTSVFGGVLALALIVPAAMMAKRSGDDAKGVEAAITQLEQEGVKAEMAGDCSFAKSHLTDDYTEGTSWGGWFDKATLMANCAAPDKNKASKRDVTDLKVRAYGDNTAIATSRESYDRMINGEHRARTIILTDTWVNMNGTWKLAASHASQADQKIAD